MKPIILFNDLLRLLHQENWRENFTYKCNYCHYNGKKKQILFTDFRPFGRSEIYRFKNYLKKLGLHNFKMQCHKVISDKHFNITVKFKN